jgi:hypothetical protein
MVHVANPFEIMWAIAGTDERRIGMAAVARRVVGITLSEVAPEGVISIQRDLAGPTEEGSVKMVSEAEPSFVKGKSAPLANASHSSLISGRRSNRIIWLDVQ